jgi:hypothetical protein
LGCICKNDALDISTFELLSEALKNTPSDIELFRQTKKYQPNREQEIFIMMNYGLLLSEQSRYDLLLKLYTND